MTILDEHKKLLDRVRDQSSKGRLVMLVGSGVSIPPPSNRPSWTALVEHMATHAAQFSETRAKAILEQKTTDLLAAIDLYEIGNAIPRREREKFLRDEFQTTAQQVPEICRSLAEVDAKAWITTNYDSNLRFALQNTVHEIFFNSDEDMRAAISLLGSQPMLVHLHGRAATPELMVLGSSSYERLTSREVYKQFLRDVLLNYSVVAIGFSFSDPPMIKLLQYIDEELGGAGRQNHLAVLPDNTGADKALLHRANFELVLYDASNGHEYADECVRHLARRSVRGTGVVVADTLPTQVNIDQLVRILSSLTSRHRNNTFDMAAGAIVAHELQDRPQRRDVLKTRVSRDYGLSSELAQQLVERGVTALIAAEALEDGPEPLRLNKDAAPPAPYPEITRAIKARILSISRQVGRSGKAQDAALDVIRRVMIVQGMTAARSFLNEDRPDSYVLSQVVDAAVSLVPIPTESVNVLRTAVIEVLRDPSPEVSRELFHLASAAFALEAVFLNPVESGIGDALGWRLYLDSNVAMRALHPACDASGGITKLLARLRQLRVPMFILGPIFEEIMTHVDVIEREAQALRTPERVAEYLNAVPEREHSPILLWYYWGTSKSQWSGFSEFRKKSSLVNSTSVKALLAKSGVELEGEDAVRRLDTGDREALWAELRRWRKEDQFSQGARRLRRAEATQVKWIAAQRDEGVRAWFLSQDGQLRRALKFIERGKYAGFVTTPTAWMLKLNQVHWGEVDVAGFSELMWAVPLTPTVERLKKMVAAEVLGKNPDLAGMHPEWLRDQIEGLFGDVESMIEADVDGSGNEADAVYQWSQQLVPRSVESILDQLALHAEVNEDSKSTPISAGRRNRSPMPPRVQKPKPKQKPKQKPKPKPGKKRR